MLRTRTRRVFGQGVRVSEPLSEARAKDGGGGDPAPRRERSARLRAGPGARGDGQDDT